MLPPPQKKCNNMKASFANWEMCVVAGKKDLTLSQKGLMWQKQALLVILTLTGAVAPKDAMAAIVAYRTESKTSLLNILEFPFTVVMKSGSFPDFKCKCPIFQDTSKTFKNCSIKFPVNNQCLEVVDIAR